MCRFKSAIILKDEVFVPDYDHHSKMLAELKIKNTRKNAERLFIRAELLPPNGNVFSPVEEWEFCVDQDIIPDWYVAEHDKRRMIEAVKKWAEKHIFIGKDNLTLSDGGTYYLKNCKDATLRGKSTATLRENSTATLRGKSTAILWENSTAILWENSTVTLFGDNTATLYGDSTAILWGNSTAILYVNSTAILYADSTAILPNSFLAGRVDNCVLMGNSTLKDCKTKTIYQSGSWKYVEVVRGNKEDNHD